MGGERADDLLDDGVARAPGDVPARDRVSRRVEAPLGPVHDRQELHADAVEIVVDEIERAVAVELRPAARPRVALAETRERKPVVERELGGVGDAGLPLMRRADEVDAAERLLGEAAEVLGHVLVEEENGLSVVEQLVRGDEPREPRAGDDDVRLQRFPVIPETSRLSRGIAEVHLLESRACLRRHGRRRRGSRMRSRASVSSRAESSTSWSEASRRGSRSSSEVARSGRRARSRSSSEGWNGRLALWVVAAGLFAFVLFRAAQCLQNAQPLRADRLRRRRAGQLVSRGHGRARPPPFSRRRRRGGAFARPRAAWSLTRGDAARSSSEGRSPSSWESSRPCGRPSASSRPISPRRSWLAAGRGGPRCSRAPACSRTAPSSR